ncbi:MAG TPA: FISUMP domain-containing protein [Bacteroidota bacterium]|nr:FISUMP domain-containing protein [Bacteroidota bacterium]
MKTIAGIIMLSAMLGGQAFTQSMVVYKTDSTTLTIPLSEIDSITFTAGGTVSCPESLSYGGKTYHAVQIGEQCWMRENLDIGTMIDSLQDASNNGTIEKYCYRNDPLNCADYGGLYQWDEAMQYSTTPGVQGICPVGWHIPTAAEFDTLRSAVSNDGNALKAIGQGTGGGAGTNTSGFSALLAGGKDSDGYFGGLGRNAYFWSSAEYDATAGYNLGLYDLSNDIELFGNGKIDGFSVRCLED